MCGIIAIHSFGPPVDRRVLERATAALGHRGPDGRRTWTSPSGEVGLGHTRLAIIDPEGGRQPITSEDGRTHVVVNGEFYGFEATRRELAQRGHRFSTGSDSEIAIHLYEDLGTRFVDRLRGQFALVVWDERTRTLVAARDRFGIKPLFYSEWRGGLYIASEAKALIAAGVEPRWDTEATYRALHACPDQRASLFEGIRQVPPGCLLVSRGGTTRLQRYWDLPEPLRDHEAPPVDVVGEVRARLERSVNERMRADVPVGCYLSGGLDSSAILGLGAAGASEPMTAFTVGFDDEAFDERSWAAEAAKHSGALHEIVSVTDRDLADNFHQAVRHGETLQYNGHAPARFLLSRRVQSKGFKCVLAGEGADELFYGYEFTRAAARASSRSLSQRLRLLTRLFRSPRRRVPGLHATSPWLARLVTLLSGTPALLDRLDGGVKQLRSTLDQDFLNDFSGLDVYRDFYDRCEQAAGLASWKPARRITYLWFRSLFSGYHLAADRLDMAHGVEVRFPFLDHELFEFTQQIPLAALAGTEQEKQLLNEAVADVVPLRTRTRPKKPFWAPPDSALANSAMSELVHDVLRGSTGSAVPMLDPAGVRGVLDSLPHTRPEHRRSLDSLLLSLTSLAILQESYGIGSS
ncbi:MAG: asparagine synthase (glutamine-hydrolyzing) [Gemmatimonadetes bacterium]|nr:asparagine synthase (glutamine-hydrolyzing) [Gemmatimonadota bacterium]